MKKYIKMISIIFLIIIILLNVNIDVFAGKLSDQLKDLNPDIKGAQDKSKNLFDIAGKILGIMQIICAIATVVLTGIFGFNFILGSAEKKASFKESFIPLIIGIVILFSAVSIGKLVFWGISTK